MASNNIRGITIEIGGNTTKLNDALKNTNKVTKDLQSELRGVNTLLKTDPTNVVLLTQKQELLTKAIQETESKLDVLKEAERQVQEQFARGEVSEEQYRNLQREIIATEQRLQNFRNQQESVNDSFSKLTAKISEQESELETLRRRYSNYILDGQEASEEARDLANRINELSNELNENRTRLNSAAQATEELSEAEEQAGEQAEQSSDGGFTILKGTLANIAADTIPKVIDAFKELATESEDAMSSIKAATGSSAVEMGKYKDVLTEVYSGNYGESLQDVAETITIIIQQMGDLDNTSLKNITTGALMLRDTFGFDVPESIRATKSMMKQFGITADEAYNLIVQGAQNGLNQNDDLLDTINEYSVQFAKAGYSADDMFNMLQNGADEGTWSIDKLGDAVKEFGIRMTDGTANDYLTQLGLNADEVTAKFAKGGESAKEATQEVMKALLECQDPQQQYIAGQGIMGTMWEDLGVDAVNSLMDTKGAIESTNDAMSKADTSKYDTISSKVAEMGRTLKTEILQPIVDEISPIIHDILDFCIENMSTLEPIIVGVASALGLLMIIGTIEALVNGFQKAFLLLNSTMLANPIVLIVTAIMGLIAAIKYLWDTNEGFRNAVTAIWEKVKSAIGTIIDGICSFFTETIPNAWNSLVEWFEGIPEWWQGIWQKVSDFFSDIWNGICSFFTETIPNAWNSMVEWIQGIPEWWQGIWQKVSDFFSSIWDSMLKNPVIASVVDTITKLWDNAKTTLENVWTNIKTAAKAAWEMIKNIILGPVLLVIDLVTGNFTKLKEDAQKIWDNIKNAAITIWESIQEAIQNIVLGFVNNVIIVVDGFKNTISEIWEGIKRFATETWEGIKTAVVNAAVGLKESAVNTFTSLKESIAQLWENIKTGAHNTWENIKNFVVNTASNLKESAVNAFKNMVSGIKEKLSGLGGTVKDGFNESISFIKSLPEKALGWGKDFIEGFVKGIKKTIGKVKDAVEEVGDKIRSFLHFSVPDEGPLTDYETWMPDFMEGLAEGINNSKWKVTEAIKDLSSDMKISMQLQSGVKGSPSAISTDNSKNITQNVTINSPQELSPSETARRNKQMLQEFALQL